MSERVQVVVGQLQLLERDELPHPMGSGGGGVRVDVQPPGHRGLGLARHRPVQREHHDVTDLYNNSTMTSQTCTTRAP